jgi:transposase InsO family protein
LDAAVKASFDGSSGNPGTYGSPRVWEDLVAAGWRVSKKTVAASMARRGLQGRSPKRKRCWLTHPDKAAAPIPDLVKRDFNAETVDQRWCGDLTEIPTDKGKLYLATGRAGRFDHVGEGRAVRAAREERVAADGTRSAQTSDGLLGEGVGTVTRYRWVAARQATHNLLKLWRH